jgi:arylsulfatase A-like enzyme
VGTAATKWRRAALAAALLAAAAGGCEQPARPPNVILISLDTLRRDRLNCYGYEARRLTPNIDALGSDGVLFENQVSSSPWTIPSHLSLLTSLAPSTHGVTSPFFRQVEALSDGKAQRLPDQRVTLAEALAARGYATGAFTGGSTMDAAFGFGQGFETYDVSFAKMSEARLDALKAWIGQHRQRPFFLFWHTFEVHQPYLHTRFVHEVVPGELAREVEAVMAELARRPHERLPPPWLDRLLALKPHSPRIAGALYDGGVLSADRWVGRLTAFLKKSGLYDRTLVVLTSDHGEELWDRPKAGQPSNRVFGIHGHSLHDELVGVPLVIKLPGQEWAGTRVASVTRAVDVMPTILDLVQAPTSPDPAMEGKSLRPLWEGSETGVRIAFSEALAFEYEQKSVRDGRYKYVIEISGTDVERHGRGYWPETPRQMLFDLLADPAERTNLLAGGRPGEGTDLLPWEARAAALAVPMDRRLRGYVRESRGRAETVTLSPETLAELEALGYVE